jgi:anthranilate phosphoribosyltransferase
VEPLAHVLNNLGHERAWVVHGHDGLDELSTTGPSTVAEVRGGQVRTFEVQPEDAGLRRATLADLKGGDAERNSHVIRALLDGEHGPFRDIVLFAAAAALVVADRAPDLSEGAAIAAEAVDTGRARRALEAMAAISHGRMPT